MRERKDSAEKRSDRSSSVFKAGAVSLVFLVIGYQAALFINRAAILGIEAARDSPDTKPRRGDSCAITGWIIWPGWWNHIGIFPFPTMNLESVPTESVFSPVRVRSLPLRSRVFPSREMALSATMSLSRTM